MQQRLHKQLSNQDSTAFPEAIPLIEQCVLKTMDDINDILRDLSLFEPKSKESHLDNYGPGKSSKPVRPPPPPPVTQITSIKKAAIPLPLKNGQSGIWLFHFQANVI